MDEVRAALQPLVVRPPSPPRPLDEIAGRARRRRARRRGLLAAVTAVGIGVSAWGVTGLDGAEPTMTLGPADADEPTAPGMATPSSTEPEPASQPESVNPVLTSTIEDTDIGGEPGMVEYTGGSWTQCGGCNIATDDSSYYYGYEAGQTYTVRFRGVQLKVFAPDDLAGGVAEVTVDRQPAATPTVDFLTSGTPVNGLRWDSGVLADGDHAVTFTILPGRPDNVALFDKAEVYTNEAGAPAPEQPEEPAAPPPPAQSQAGVAPGLLGAGVHDPYEFASWLGRPVDVWETWNNDDPIENTTWELMESTPSLHANWTGEGDVPFNVRWTGKGSIGQPMWAGGENAATCNSGANDGHMTNVANAIKNAGFGDAYIRLGWEMDGSWFGSVNGAWQDPAGWVECWKRWHRILKGVSPAFKMVWNPNFESNTGAGEFDVRTVWPGDEYVDAAGPDIYDWNKDPNQTGFNGAPVGINAWVDFVVNQHHKPFAMPEWAVETQGGGDDPAFVELHMAVLKDLKNKGQLEYASYFALGGCTHAIHVDGCNPNASEAYRTAARAF
jgi:hypothetical protein